MRKLNFKNKKKGYSTGFQGIQSVPWTLEKFKAVAILYNEVYPDELCKHIGKQCLYIRVNEKVNVFKNPGIIISVDETKLCLAFLVSGKRWSIKLNGDSKETPATAGWTIRFFVRATDEELAKEIFKLRSKLEEAVGINDGGNDINKQVDNVNKPDKPIEITKSIDKPVKPVKIVKNSVDKELENINSIIKPHPRVVKLSEKVSRVGINEQNNISNNIITNEQIRKTNNINIKTNNVRMNTIKSNNVDRINNIETVRMNNIETNNVDRMNNMNNTINTINTNNMNKPGNKINSIDQVSQVSTDSDSQSIDSSRSDLDDIQ